MKKTIETKVVFETFDDMLAELTNPRVLEIEADDFDSAQLQGRFCMQKTRLYKDEHGKEMQARIGLFPDGSCVYCLEPYTPEVNSEGGKK